MFDGQNLILDLEGMIDATVPAQSTASFDIVKDYDYLVTGVDYHALDCNPGDRATFEVYRPDTGALIARFANRIFVRDNRIYEFYKAKIPKGLIVRVTYENLGPNPVRFTVNLIKHRYKEG